MSDLWRLPVVQKAYKEANGKTYIVVNDGIRHLRLTDGDTLLYDTHTGEWDAILTTESYRLNQ